MANAKLDIVKTKMHKFTFGAGSTPYARFECRTQNGTIIPVAITHRSLEGLGIKTSLLGKLEGSSFIVQDSTSLFTGEIVEGDEFVNSFVNGTMVIEDPTSKKFGQKPNILLLNSGNCSVSTSEIYDSKSEELISKIESQLIVTKEKEDRILRAERAAQALPLFNLSPKQVAVTEEEDELELEINDDDVAF